MASLYVLAGYYVWGHTMDRRGMHIIAAHVNAWEVSIGLLLLSISAATSLAEERDRGSLDVIMTTPLTTREIVWGKWWGTFAMVPRLAILPIWVSAGAAMVTDGGIGLVLMIGLILAYSAAITSLGLAAATWIPRLDRVITVSVLTFLIISVGWPLVVNLLRVFPPTDEGLVVASPFFGVYATTEWAAEFSFGTNGHPWWGYGPTLAHNPTWPLVWIGVYFAIALFLAVATLLTFDYCLGRVTDARRLP